MSHHSFNDRHQSLLEQNLVKTSNKCPNCGRDYRHRRSLWQHIRYECGKEPQFSCPYCHKKMKLKGNLKQHMTLVHGKQL
ncbi:hypothetical protein C0J52_13319 [Blattella germanica]|nr:hypothetical protein C0J52_13319 [Blattella germanica]